MENLNNNTEQKIKAAEEEGIIKISKKENQIEYVASGKTYKLSDPEEKVRMRVYVELIKKYLYPKTRIDTEVYPPRREPKLPADVVIYRDNAKESVYAIAEVKASSKDFEIAKKEGVGNANLLNAAYLIIVCDAEPWSVFDVSQKPLVENLDHFKIPDLPILYGEEPEYKYKKGDSQWDLKEVSLDELIKIFRKCHQTLWGGGKRDPAPAFDEMSKLIFAKLYDERNTGINEYYKFQIRKTKTGEYESDEAVMERIRELYNKARSIDPKVFTEDINISADLVFYVVNLLQGVTLLYTDLDVKGQAFESFLDATFRKKMGQYFTPRTIVGFAVSVIDPQENEIIIDPACGSGGFLVYSLKQVIKKIEEKYRGEQKIIDRKIYDFGHYNLYGIEISEKIARVAMMDMIIYDDGHTNIENNTAFNKEFENKNIKLNNFSILLTNPPFGDVVQEGDKDRLGKSRLKDFSLSLGKKSQKTEILFLERCIQFLKLGGRMVSVVPDGNILTNPNTIFVREYLLKNTTLKGVVSLPYNAFKRAGTTMKTSLIFLEKRPSNKDDKVFFAIADCIGHDNNGNDVPVNDFNIILDDFYQFKNNKKSFASKFLVVPYKDITPKRLDAEYFCLMKRELPIIEESFIKKGHSLKTLGELVNFRNETPKSIPKYIELGHISKDNEIIGYTTYEQQKGYVKVYERSLTGQILKTYIEKQIPGRAKMLIKKDDILFSNLKESRKTALVLPGFDNCVASNGFSVLYLKPKSFITPEYLYYVCLGDYVKKQVWSKATGSILNSLSESEIANIKIPIPQDKRTITLITDRVKTKLQHLKTKMSIDTELEIQYPF